MTDDSTDVVTGMDDDLGVPIRRYRLRFVERQLFVQQLTGQQKIHPLASALVDWRYGYSSAFRTEPDRREYYYVSATESGEGPYHLSMRADANQRIWSELDDEVHDVGLDYTQPFKQWSGLDANVKAGAQAMVRHRDVETIRLTLSPPRPRANARVNEDVQQQSPEEIFQPDNHHGDSGWTLIDTTQPSDAYTAIQTLQAGFVMTELPLAKPLRLMGGARVEHSLQRVTTFDPWDPAGAPVVGKIDKTDVLPAVTVTYSLTDAMALRAGFGRTVSRPDFRELSQAGFRDVVRAIAYQGNPNLKRARIDNWDARWEYYFSTDELLSFGFFYKDFTNPIEQVEVPTGTERKVSYDNAAGAQNYGIELELRHRLNVLDERLESFYFATNIALIQSQIELGDAAGVATSKDRALQGQSPYVVNTQLGYDNAGEDGNGITATLLYNVFGPRISDVGRFGTPDVYEESFHQLDFVYGQKLGHGVKFGFKAKNLLNLEQIFKQGTEVSERYRRGRDFSVSLSYSY
jgi:TonB-dependent receptor